MKRIAAVFALWLCMTASSHAVIGGVENPKAPVFHFNPMSGALDSRATFTRSSTAWYWNSSGVLTSASSNTPRFDYDPATLAFKGLLIEEARTNLFLNSQSPATQNITTTAQNYTVSFYGTGSIALSGTCSGTLNGSAATTLVQLTVTATAGTCTLTVSGTITNAQFEAGSFATSRIVTAGTSVTRQGDTLSFTSIPWFNATAGTFYVELTYEGVNSTFGGAFAWFDDGSATNYIEILQANDSTVRGLLNYPANYHGTVYSAAKTAGNIIKGAVGYTSGNNRAVIDGTVLSDSSSFYTSALPSGINRLILMANYNQGSRTSGWMRRFTYWNYLKTSTEMQSYTQ